MILYIKNGYFYFILVKLNFFFGYEGVFYLYGYMIFIRLFKVFDF